jgi:hypothetical protein
MLHTESTKSVSKAAASVASSGSLSHEIDTVGFDHASIDVVFSPYTAATSSAASVLKLQSSDVSGSGQVDLTGFVGGVDFTVAAGSTTGANAGYVHRFDVDLRGRKRYLTVVATPGNTVAMASMARLSRGESQPLDAAGKGVNSASAG